MDRTAFYKSKAWRKCRDGYMQSKNYICERCGGVAAICHHKTYLNDSNYDDPNISLNWSLLESLCIDCHNKEHFQTNATEQGLTFDENGQLIKM